MNADLFNAEMKKNRLTQQETAARMGISRETLRNMLNGKAPVTIDRMQKAVKVLHLNTSTRNAIFLTKNVASTELRKEGQ